MLEPKNEHPIIIGIIARAAVVDSKYYIGCQDRIISVRHTKHVTMVHWLFNCINQFIGQNSFLENLFLFLLLISLLLSKVPKDFTFVQVFDMFYKIHKIFNLSFNKKIKPMLSLVDHYIFKFPPLTGNAIDRVIELVSKKLLEN